MIEHGHRTDSTACRAFVGVYAASPSAQAADFLYPRMDTVQEVCGYRNTPYFDFQRAAAAFFAIALRLRSLSFAARAFPPFDAPSAESACACGFLPSAGFNTSPVASSTTRSAF